MTLLDILDFETNIERAAQDVLEAYGIDAYISNTRNIQDNNDAVFIRADMEGSVDGQMTVLANGRQEYNFYSLSLVIKVQISRESDEVTRFRTVRSMVRKAFMDSNEPFTATNLPEYRVAEVIPISTENGSDDKTLTDFCSITYQVKFFVDFPNNLTS